MDRTLRLKVTDQVSTLNRITSASIRLQYNINKLYIKPASEGDMSGMTIKVHIEDEDVYRILTTKLKRQVSVISIGDVND